MLQKRIFPFVFMFVFSLSVNSRLAAQTEDISKIMEQIKVSSDLNKLNECRVKLRSIEFTQLKTKEEKEKYAEAYKQLALAFRNHKYIRPAYDIFQKYISLRDTIINEEKRNLLGEMQKKHDISHTKIMNEVAASVNEKNELVIEKTALASLKKNNFKYSAIFTILLLGVALFIIASFNKKLKTAKMSLQVNRKNIFEKSNAVTRGQMSLGVLHLLKKTNEEIIAADAAAFGLYAGIEQEISLIKETEQPMKSLKENITQIGQLAEISSKAIAVILQKLPGQ